MRDGTTPLHQPKRTHGFFWRGHSPAPVAAGALDGGPFAALWRRSGGFGFPSMPAPGLWRSVRSGVIVGTRRKAWSSRQRSRAKWRRQSKQIRSASARFSAQKNGTRKRIERARHDCQAAPASMRDRKCPRRKTPCGCSTTTAAASMALSLCNSLSNRGRSPVKHPTRS